MVSMLTLLILVIVVALIFDYINGFHDAANAIATVVSTGVLPVRTAVILAGILNFAGASPAPPSPRPSPPASPTPRSSPRSSCSAR
jgi:hypothetical protein